MHALLQSHLLQKLAQTQFAEVALGLVLRRQGLGQHVGPFAHLLRLPQIFLDGGIESLHRRGLFAVALLHRLAHLTNVLAQRVQDRGQLLLVGRGQLLLALTQNLLRSNVHLFPDERHLLFHLLLGLLAKCLHLPGVCLCLRLQPLFVQAGQLVQPFLLLHALIVALRGHHAKLGLQHVASGGQLGTFGGKPSLQA